MLGMRRKAWKNEVTGEEMQTANKDPNTRSTLPVHTRVTESLKTIGHPHGWGYGGRGYCPRVAFSDRALEAHLSCVC